MFDINSGHCCLTSLPLASPHADATAPRASPIPAAAPSASPPGPAVPSDDCAPMETTPPLQVSGTIRVTASPVMLRKLAHRLRCDSYEPATLGNGDVLKFSGVEAQRVNWSGTAVFGPLTCSGVCAQDFGVPATRLLRQTASQLSRDELSHRNRRGYACTNVNESMSLWIQSSSNDSSPLM